MLDYEDEIGVQEYDDLEEIVITAEELLSMIEDAFLPGTAVVTLATKLRDVVREEFEEVRAQEYAEEFDDYD